MRKTTWIALAAVAIVLAASAAEAQTYRRYGGDNALRFRVGMLTPDGESAYWADNAEVFTGDADGFEDIALGADFRFRLGERFGVLVSGDLWEGEEDQAYLDFVDAGGADIFHTTTLDVASLTAGLVFDILPRDAAIVPYVGAGGGFYFWTLTEEGDFIDFNDPAGPTIFDDIFEDEGEALGWYGLVGIEVPVGNTWSLFGEARWRSVEDELSGDFAGFGDLDLSGREIYAGASWRF
jgi:outer membrane protein W